jgi:hypothetical protein
MPFNASYKIDLTKLQGWADSASQTPEDSPRIIPPGLPHLTITDASTLYFDLFTYRHVAPLSRTREIALEIAAEVKRLCRSEEPVPTDVALMYAGLNSIIVVQLFFRLQAEYDYEDDMSRLFEEDASAEALARIL